jgi:hypothetical protein
MDGMAELSSLLSFVAIVTSAAVGISTLRQRANEPGEKRWADIWAWRDEVEEKLDRGCHDLNRVKKNVIMQRGFEDIMLSSMKGILDHLAEGNHGDQMKKISNEIYDFLSDRRRSEID